MPIAEVLHAGTGEADVNVVDRDRVFSYEVKISDASGNKVAELASHTGKVTVEKVNFGYLRNGGCADFSFTLSEEYTKATINYNYRVEICLYSQPNPWFTGFITKLPKKGTDTIQEYSGYGYVKQLDWVRVNEIDTAQEVADIVEDTVDNYILINLTDIQKNGHKLDSLIYQMNSTVYWTRISALDMFQRLQQLAVNYEFGVDEERDFYFRAIETNVKEKFWIGKHLTTFHSQEDAESIRNRLYVLCGRLTNGSDYVLTVPHPSLPASTSQITYGLREDVVVAPELWPPFSTTDLASGAGTAALPAGTAQGNAVNGNTANYWDSDAAQSINHYFLVDLGAPFSQIARVILDSTDNAAKDQYARGFDIRIATTVAGLAATSAVVFSSTSLSTINPDIKFSPVRGRYVQITLTTNDPEHLHLAKFEVYQIDTTDIKRWADYLLAEKEVIRKKANLTIKGIDKLISKKATIAPFKPTGQWGIYDEDGTHIDDYYVLAIKYALSPQTFDMSAELGELDTKTIPAFFRKTLQRLEEYKMSEVRSSGDLASGVGTSPLSILRTMIGKDEIQTPHLRTLSITTDKLDALAVTAAKIAAGTITAAEIAAGAITTDKLDALAVTAAKIDALAVETAKLDAGAVTADKITVADLVDIANLLTVAAGRIVIGANALGVGLDGILVNDGVNDRVLLGEIAADDYGLTIKDAAGNTMISLGSFTLGDAKARAYASVSQQLQITGPVTKIRLDSKTYDPGSNFDNSNWATGTTTGAAGNKLIDAGAAFVAAMVGSLVKNVTDNTFSKIQTVDSPIQLGFLDNIFAVGEDYSIIQSKFVAPIDGDYLCVGSIGFQIDVAALMDEAFATSLRKNDASYSSQLAHSGSLPGNTGVTSQITDIIPLAVNDEVTLWGSHSADDVHVHLNTGSKTFLCVHLLSAA